MVFNLVQGMRLKSAGLALFASLALAGCGGGGGEPGTTNAPLTLDLSVAYGASTPANTVTATTPATITAKLTDVTGHGVANAVVIFSAPGGLTYTATNGTTGPSNGSGLTNSAGVATISVLADGSLNGAVNVTASTVVGTKSAQNFIGVTVAVP